MEMLEKNCDECLGDGVVINAHGIEECCPVGNGFGSFIENVKSNIPPNECVFLNNEELKKDFIKLKNQPDFNIKDWWVSNLKSVGFEYEVMCYMDKPTLRFGGININLSDDDRMKWAFNFNSLEINAKVRYVDIDIVVFYHNSFRELMGFK